MQKGLSEWNVNYLYGNKTKLWASWKDENVLLNESKLFYITEGEIIIKTENGLNLCKKGDLVLIPAGVKHDYYLSDAKNAEKFWMHFTLTQNGVSIFDGYELPVHLHVKDFNAEKLFENCIKNIETEADSLIRSSSILQLCAYYIKEANAKKSAPVPDEIDDAIQYILEHLSTNVSLNALAQRANLSLNYFIRKFSKKTGMAPMRFLLNSRLERAKRLLSNTDLSISDVMQSVGINDLAYFSKLIKNETGYSPRVFRQMAKNKDSR